MRFDFFFNYQLAKEREELPSIKNIRRRCLEQLDQMRPDHMRILNPTPYKVFLFSLVHKFRFIYTIRKCNLNFTYFVMKFSQYHIYTMQVVKLDMQCLTLQNRKKKTLRSSRKMTKLSLIVILCFTCEM